MARLNLLLCLEGPEFETNGRDYDALRHDIKLHGREGILWPVGHTINNGLDAFICQIVPNLDHFVRAKTDQVVALFVDLEACDGRIMTIQVG